MPETEIAKEIQTYHVKLWGYENIFPLLDVLLRRHKDASFSDEKLAKIKVDLIKELDLIEMPTLIKHFLLYVKTHAASQLESISRFLAEFEEDNNKIYALIADFYINQFANDAHDYVITQGDDHAAVDLMMPFSTLLRPFSRENEKHNLTSCLENIQENHDVACDHTPIQEIACSLLSGDDALAFHEQFCGDSPTKFSAGLEPARVFSLLLILHYLSKQHPGKQVVVQVIDKDLHPHVNLKKTPRAVVLRNGLEYLQKFCQDLIPSNVLCRFDGGNIGLDVSQMVRDVGRGLEAGDMPKVSIPRNNNHFSFRCIIYFFFSKFKFMFLNIF